MSELIAEARVLVTPDTTTFRTLLTAQLAQATTGVTVPVAVTPVAGNQANTAALAAQSAALATQEQKTADAINGATAAKQRAISPTLQYERRLAGLTSGAASSALSLVGLRGATLAATGPFLAGAAGAIALGRALSIATSFNSEIAVLGATIGATGPELERAAAAAREFGRDITLPGVTAGDAAQTITEFAKAGLDLNDSIAATRGGLQLAQAAQISYADSVTLTANALNAFGLSGNQAVRVADTLANAANLAQGGIGDMALALRQAAGAAAVVGVSFEDTSALLTLLARNGLTGSDAGTALRTAFLRLVNPSKEARKILEDLNVELRDINGNVRPEVFADFAAAQRDLSAAAQQANAAIVFGQDAFRAFGFLGREGTRGLQDVQAGLDQTGTAARIAQARMTGLAGAQENLSNQLTAFGETLGQVVIPPLTLFVNELASFVAAGNQAIGVAKGVADAFADIVPPAPPGSGFLFDIGKEIFKTGNPIGQAMRIRDLFGEGNDVIEEEIKNGGVELRSALEESGRQAARGADAFGTNTANAIQQAFDLVQQKLAEAQQAFRAQSIRDIGRAQGQAAGLSEQFDALLAGGGSLQQQVAQLRRQADVQARIIREAGPNAQGVVLQARREAQARLASINQQIVGIERQIASDQKAASEEAARIREDAARASDLAFLQGQEDQRTRAEQRITVAEDTPQLADDIRRQTQLRALLQQQIQALRQSAVDERTKAEAIRQLRAAVFATTQEIKGLKAAQEEQRAQQKQAAADELRDNLSLRTQIAEARGDDDAILRALNAEIANQRKRVVAAKKARKGVLEEQLALEQLLKQRRELQQQVDDADSDAVGGTSLADLFQKAEQIASGAGNVGGINSFNVRAQPRIQAEVQERLDIVGNPAAAAAARQERATQTLIQAIDRLTNAITGNSASGTPIARGEQNQWRNLTQAQRFYNQRTAKQMVEQGLVG